METSRTSSDLLLRLLSATELRARVISANIANQNTPGYTRQEVRFEEQLKRVLERGGKPGDLAAEAGTVEALIASDVVAALPDAFEQLRSGG